MNPRRLVAAAITPVVSLLLVLAVAAPAQAVTLSEKLTVMYNWSQTSSTSYNAWNSARQNQGAWSAYNFNWSTDYCSASPDQPLGFDFRLSCYRHDFGYRNYKAVGQFTSTNKSRIDSAFYADLKRKCATYSVLVQTSCYGLAWSYYEAVATFGSLSAVSQSDLDRAAATKARAEAAAAGVES